MGSTIADLLNNYTSDIESLIGSDVDSELQQLDWSDWEDDFQEDQVAPQDIQNYYELLKDIESLALPQTSSEEGCHKPVWPENQLLSLPTRDPSAAHWKCHIHCLTNSQNLELWKAHQELALPLSPPQLKMSRVWVIPF